MIKKVLPLLPLFLLPFCDILYYSDLCGMEIASLIGILSVIYCCALLTGISYRQKSAYLNQSAKPDKWWIFLFCLTVIILMVVLTIWCLLPMAYLLSFGLSRIYAGIKKEKTKSWQFAWNLIFYINLIVLIIHIVLMPFAVSRLSFKYCFADTIASYNDTLT